MNSSSAPSRVTAAGTLLPIDVVMPGYNEDPAAVDLTVRAVMAQSWPAATVTIVDDCSREPIAPSSDPRVRVIRLPCNSGVSAARNEGAKHARSPIIAFLNIEVIPRGDWLEVCARYLMDHPRVGVVAVKTVPEDLRSARTRWRLRYQEVPYPLTTGPIDWGTGHALIFRAEAFSASGGFDESMRKAGEDVDICRRLRPLGWDVHFVAETGCTSVQQDSLRTLAKAEYNRFTWRADTGNGLLRGIAICTSRAAQRGARHLIFLRWSLLPVEVGLWFVGLGFAWRHR